MSRRKIKRAAWAWVAGALTWLALAQALALAQEGSGTAQITYPAAGGAPVFGVAQITGRAYCSDFVGYELYYDTDPSSLGWIAVQAPVSQQVVDEGVLGQWDTRDLPDGVYQLQLVVRAANGDSFSTVVNGVAVSNTQPTALPTMAPTPTLTFTPGPATQGPSPTPLIVQPPTVTPVPTTSAGGLITESEPRFPSAAQPGLSPATARLACCRGAAVGFMGLVLAALYSSTRPRWRPYLVRWRNRLRRRLRL